MPDKRYGQTEQAKEQQAKALKRRFAAYLGEPPRGHAVKTRRRLGIFAIALIAVVAYAIWRLCKGA